jgi:hypothetical protein
LVTLTSGANALLTTFQNKLEVLAIGKPLKPDLMFVGKAGAYPIQEPFRRSNLG